MVAKKGEPALGWVRVLWVRLIHGFAVVTASIVGPTLGGWTTDNYDWRWIFFINITIAILSLFLTHRLVEDTPKIKKEVEDAKRGGFRLDLIGFGLVALTFGSLEVVLDKGQEDDWFGSNFIVAFTMLAVIGLIALIVWELRQAQGRDRPVLDLKLFASRNFSVSFLMMFVFGSPCTRRRFCCHSFFNHSWGIRQNSPVMPCPAEVWRRSFACRWWVS